MYQIALILASFFVQNYKLWFEWSKLCVYPLKNKEENKEYIGGELGIERTNACLSQLGIYSL